MGCNPTHGTARTTKPTFGHHIPATVVAQQVGHHGAFGLRRYLRHGFRPQPVPRLLHSRHLQTSYPQMRGGR